MAKAGAGSLSQAVPRSIDGVAGLGAGRVLLLLLLGVPRGARGGGGGSRRGDRRGGKDVCVEEVVGLRRRVARSQLPAQTKLLGVVQGVSRDGGAAVDEALDGHGSAPEEARHSFLALALVLVIVIEAVVQLGRLGFVDHGQLVGIGGGAATLQGQVGDAGIEVVDGDDGGLGTPGQRHAPVFGGGGGVGTARRQQGGGGGVRGRRGGGFAILSRKREGVDGGVVVGPGVEGLVGRGPVADGEDAAGGGRGRRGWRHGGRHHGGEGRG